MTGVITLAAAFVGQPAAFAAVAGAGAVLAVVVAVAGRRPPTRLARWLRRYVLAATGLLLFGGVAVCLAGLSSWSGTVAVGVLAGVGIWTLLGWWLLWWAEEHPAASPAEPVRTVGGAGQRSVGGAGAGRLRKRPITGTSLSDSARRIETTVGANSSAES